MSSSMMGRTISQTDVLVGRVCEAVLSVLPRTLTPEVLLWEVEDLGELVPEWAAADGRKSKADSPTEKKTESTAQEAAPVA